MTISRRALLRNSAIGAGVLAVGNVPGLLTAPAAFAKDGVGGLGPLIPDPAGLVDLPARFSYEVISKVGDPLSGGGVMADRFDGSGLFARRGRNLRIVTNHEIGTASGFPAVADPSLTYDPGAFGGTSTSTLDRDNHILDQRVSLAGTYNNCAGGITPWGTWLTCEETETLAGGALTRDHGYVFEVDPVNLANNVDPTPIEGLGRYAHEAVAIDPTSGHVYLTEDASGPHGLVYRFVPNRPLGGYGSLREGGVLTAMRCSKAGVPVPDLCDFTDVGTELDVAWAEVPDPSALVQGSTRKQFTYGTTVGAGGDVTRSRKFEGAWWGRGKVFIVCSYARVSDGSTTEHDGQVWSFDPHSSTLRLEVRFGVNPDYASTRPDGPDNITVAPYGGLILAEDGEGTSCLQLVTRKGRVFPLARNARDDGEWTGPCFSPDGRTLFANLQEPAVKVAITGNWSRLSQI